MRKPFDESQFSEVADMNQPGSSSPSHAERIRLLIVPQPSGLRNFLETPSVEEFSMNPSPDARPSPLKPLEQVNSRENLIDPSSLEYFKNPFDPFDYKDGRKLSGDELFVRLTAYMAKYGSEVYTKTPNNCDAYWTSDPTDPSFTTAAKTKFEGEMPDFDFSAAWKKEMERRRNSSGGEQP